MVDAFNGHDANCCNVLKSHFHQGRVKHICSILLAKLLSLLLIEFQLFL